MHSNKVLIVDDNPINVEILQEILADEYLLEVALNGHDAIRIATRFRPKVILLDVMMPGMDGLETCRRLRESAELGHTAIVMVSAKALPCEQAAGVNAGADDYLTKPFDEEELLARVHRYASAAQPAVSTTCDQ